MIMSVMFISCQKDKPVKDTVQKDGYDLKITGEDDYKLELIGENIDLRWDPNVHTIYLGTDENNEPLGTLTMIVESNLEANKFCILTSASLSKTDVRVGTAGEFNAKLYKTESEQVFYVIELNQDLIHGELDDVLMKDVKTGELVIVNGWFIATVSD